MSTHVIELAEKIKAKGQASACELTELLEKAEALAHDVEQDGLTRALAHRAAGNARQLMNQFQAALESYNAAADLLETLDQPVELGRTLSAKVGMLFTLSRFAELFECSARARRLFEQCSDAKRLARLDVNLAHAYHRLGKPKEALECSERALHALEGMGDWEGYVAASINSAVTFTSMHEFERAEERFCVARRVAAELNMSSWVRLSRYNLAYLRYLSGDTAAAWSELQTLKREYERANDEWMTCQCWLDESEILLEIGDLDDSLAAARQARTLAIKLHLNSETAKSLLYEAAAQLRLGRNVEARPLLDEAAGRFAIEGDQVSTAAAQLQTALLRSENGDAATLQDAVSARELLRETGLPHLRALSEIVVGRIQRAAGEVDGAVDSFRSALNLAEGSRSRWMQFHAAYELGLSLDQQNRADGIRMFERADGLLDSLWDQLGSDHLKMTFLADRENVYTHLVRSSLLESPAAALRYSEKARSRVLRERLLQGDANPSATVIGSKLSADEVIVEYFISGEDLCVFVIRRDGLICKQVPGAVPRLQSEWRDLERHIDSCGVKWEHLASVRGHLELTAQVHLRNLYDVLVAPIENELRSTVIFAPHGFLHNIPFHALNDGKQHLAERFHIAYTPSASLYCAPAAPQEFREALFIAFSTSPRSSSIREVEEAASFVDGAETLLNPSIEELRSAFAVPRSLVHMAGHAGIDPISGKFSWIDTPRGRLTSRDVADIGVRARTIVITGCRTARRMIQPGDEWLGLMRSFYLSGASTIVSALWDVRDESARCFAVEFYKGWGQNSPLAAVQRAAARVRAQHAHPYFWAGFEAFIRREE